MEIQHVALQGRKKSVILSLQLHFRKKHHDADSSHICREKLSDVASISTLEEEHFLTSL
jgi:hypothetical protein